MQQPNQICSQNRLLWVLTISLLAITLLTYWPALEADFLNWDDLSYVAQNDYVRGGLTTEGIRWTFTQSHSGNWHPITWISHMLDCELFGLKPAGHHLVNIIIHSFNGALLLLLLRHLTGSLWRSVVVAMVFALHPLRVESVAWIAERKDVLSSYFGLLTLMGYTKYVTSARDQKPSSKRWNVWYLLTLGLFVLGLMSKPMLVTWPCIMLLLDLWPLRRLDPSRIKVRFPTLKRLVLEKIPFAALSGVSCVITFLAQKKGGAVAPVESLPLTARMENALVACLKYLELLFWPSDLSPIYFHPHRWPAGIITLSAIVLVMTCGLVWIYRNRFPFAIVGWLWFLGTLVPVIGIVQVGAQAYADRYTYIPHIGLLIALVWLLTAWFEKLRITLAMKTVLLIVTAAVLAYGTRQQLRYWENTETLFRRALAINPDIPHALHALGGHFMDKGHTEEGKMLLERAIELQPAYPEALGALANRFDAQGNYADAIKFYRAALAAQPDHSSVLNNMAWLLASCPDANFRDGKEAVRLATRACELTGYTKPIFIGTLAAAHAEAGDFQTAIATAERAAKLATSLNLQETATHNRELIELYRQGKAAHGEKPKRE